MSSVVETAIKKLKKQNDDDVVDRINYFWTPTLLGVFGVLLAAKQYVGEPLQCWLPAQFKDQWEKYAESYCFVENTYFVGFNESFPRTNPEREDRELPYYQWVPFMLTAQIILFLLPKTIWNAFSLRAGVHINSLVEKAMMFVKGKNSKDKANKKLKSTKQDQYDAALKLNEILDYNIQQKKLQNHQDQSTPNYVTKLYLFFKLLNLIVCVAQLLLLNHFIAPNYSFWGWDILVGLYQGLPWQHSGHFPRVTYCDINIREQGGHMVQHTFQCVLMINMFNEKVYLFIWFWLVFLALADLGNLGKWLYHTFNKDGGETFVRANLILDNSPRSVKQNYCSDDLKQFVRTKLGRDGLTILRLISANCGSMASSIIVTALFNTFLQKQIYQNDMKKKVEEAKKADEDKKKREAAKREEQAKKQALGGGDKKDTGKKDKKKPSGTTVEGARKPNNSSSNANAKKRPANNYSAPPTGDGPVPNGVKHRHIHPDMKAEFAKRASEMGVPIVGEELDNPQKYIDNMVDEVKRMDSNGEPVFDTYATIVPGVIND